MSASDELNQQLAMSLAQHGLQMPFLGDLSALLQQQQQPQPPPPPMPSAQPDLLMLLQAQAQINSLMASPPVAAHPPPPPQRTVPVTSAATSLLNPLSLLALSQLQPINPLYANLAKMMLAMNAQNLGQQMMQSDLLPTFNQQQQQQQQQHEQFLTTLSRSLPMQQLLVQQQPPTQMHVQQLRAPPMTSSAQMSSTMSTASSSNGHQLLHHHQNQQHHHHHNGHNNHTTSLKRGAATNHSSQEPRKRACLNRLPARAQLQPQQQQKLQPTASVSMPAPLANNNSNGNVAGASGPTTTVIVNGQPKVVPLRALTPEWRAMKEFFANISDEDKAKNEYFRKEVMRRLDIILLEELGPIEKKEDKKENFATSLVADPNDTIIMATIIRSKVDDDEDEIDVDVDVDETADEEKSSDEEKDKEKTLTITASADDSPTTTATTTTSSSAFRRVAGIGSTSPVGTTNSSSAFTSPSSSPSSVVVEDAVVDPPPPLPDNLRTTVRMLGLERRNYFSVDGDDGPYTSENVFTEKHPKLWEGKLSLKAVETSVALHLIDGSKQLVFECFGDIDEPTSPTRDVVRINQRLRTNTHEDWTALHDLMHRMSIMRDCVVLVAMPTGEDHAHVRENEHKLQTSFIDYFNMRRAAGAANLPEDPPLHGTRIHVFAPCDFSREYMKSSAKGLLDHLDATEAKYVFIVLTPSDAGVVPPPMELPMPLTSAIAEDDRS